MRVRSDCVGHLVSWQPFLIGPCGRMAHVTLLMVARGLDQLLHLGVAQGRLAAALIHSLNSVKDFGQVESSARRPQRARVTIERGVALAFGGLKGQFKAALVTVGRPSIHQLHQPARCRDDGRVTKLGQTIPFVPSARDMKRWRCDNQAAVATDIQACDYSDAIRDRRTRVPEVVVPPPTAANRLQCVRHRPVPVD